MGFSRIAGWKSIPCSSSSPGMPHTPLPEGFGGEKGREVGSCSPWDCKNKVWGLVNNVWPEQTNTAPHKEPGPNKLVLLSLKPIICMSVFHRVWCEFKGTTMWGNSPQQHPLGHLEIQMWLQDATAWTHPCIPFVLKPNIQS